MGKRRRKRAGFWLKGICLILLVPVFITTLMQRMRLENLIYGKEYLIRTGRDTKWRQ